LNRCERLPIMDATVPHGEHMTYHIVATEGATVDGRNISAIHLEQMAKNYDPKRYGARIWLEHMRGLFADSSFAALGDVTDLKTDKNAEGKTVLLAQLAPTPELVKINQSGQKVFTSVEIDPNFAGSGEAYLVGLGVTDSPASVGTSRLKFAAAQQREQTHIFSDYCESAPQNEPSVTENNEQGLLSRIKGLFAKTDKAAADTNTRLNTLDEATVALAEGIIQNHAATQQTLQKLSTDIAALRTVLDGTPATPAATPEQHFASTRPMATGSSQPQTDC
jgi:phage capsid scaffolding protein (GPO) serine peptidase